MEGLAISRPVRGGGGGGGSDEPFPPPDPDEEEDEPEDDDPEELELLELDPLAADDDESDRMDAKDDSDRARACAPLLDSACVVG